MQQTGRQLHAYSMRVHRLRGAAVETLTADLSRAVRLDLAT